MSLRDFILSTFSDERGSVSHKRILATIGSFVLFGAFLHTKDTHLADLIFWLICLWGGLATIDKFSK